MSQRPMVVSLFSAVSANFFLHGILFEFTGK